MAKIEIITQEELLELQKYEGIERNPDGYAKLPTDALVLLCKLKDKNNDMLVRRYYAACSVIDIMAKVVGINPDDTGWWLYAPDGEDGGSSPVARKMEELISRSGDKATLKKKVQELEEENRVLRSLITKR